MTLKFEPWELVSRKRRIRSKQRASDTWLHRPIPSRHEVADANAALETVASTCWEECCEELLNTREMTGATTETPARVVRSLNKRWDALLASARQKVAAPIKAELGENPSIEPLYPETRLQEKFFEARRSTAHNTVFTYHGTKAQNIDSISRIGLLMPGKNGHQVANGSAHGVGIYSAKLGAASLSRGFCDSPKMFLCAVCDPSQPPEENAEQLQANQWKPSTTVVQTTFPKKPTAVNVHPSARKGRHEVHRRSDEVIHVGDAVVTFQEGFVVPLFLLSTEEEPQSDAVNKTRPKQIWTHIEDPQHKSHLVLQHHAWKPVESQWAVPQQVGRRRLAVPEPGARLIRFGRDDIFGHDDTCRKGRTVWIVSDPLHGRSSHEIWVKRRLMERHRHVQRRQERRLKEDNFGHFLCD
mmetsp:Transcript_51202/g.119445  ORF Transcript_51202/g.119445 Transcript_51202/m.119445 type:complete len:412 (-) Transcript_51202:234-1469(-)